MKSLSRIATAVSLALHVSGLHAEGYLAQRQNSDTHRRDCKIAANHGVLESTGLYGAKLRERTMLEPTFAQIYNQNAKEAILGVQKPFYRWSADSEIYKIADSEGTLIDFYTIGFENRLNTTNAAKVLIRTIDEICDRTLINFKILGRFEIKLEVNGEIYTDYLEIRQKTYRYLTSYESPGSFEARLTDLNYEDGSFRFGVAIQENRLDYELEFLGQFDGQDELSGVVKLKDESKTFGTFTGTRTE